ncbi:MAG: hypothetical protein QGG71_24475 [Pirellulaceae bacterium]|jgi:hypothetical protein|nr:hypothetical protein [Pirellulaceae bacterium]
MKNKPQYNVVTLIWLAIWVSAASVCSADDDAEYQQQLAERRVEYLSWIAETFGKLEPTMDPRDERRWALNHARLTLNRDVDKANRHFESCGPMRRDADIYFIRYLRTLPDFRESSRLSKEARAHLIGMLKKWPRQPAPRTHNLPNHTENHELMNLTIGMFAEQSRGGDISDYVNWIKQTLAWRFERGWVEYNSRCYQYHYSNPLIILVDYAPDENLRRGAAALLNVMLAERALLSVNGYLAGPSFRCREADAFGSLTARKTAYLTDARYDGFLPMVWMAFGMGEPQFDFVNARVSGLEPATIHIASSNEPRLKQDEAMFLACSTFRVHRIVRALAEEAKTRDVLIYKGQRYLGWPDDWSWKTQSWLPAALYYYNTPHVSMGSVHTDGAILQSRYSTILFGADPSQGLRVEVILPDVAPNKRRYETRGRIVQHKNCLIGQGTLFEDGGAKSHKVGRWNVYQVGKGLCARAELSDSYHVFHVSDLDTFADEKSFIEALSVPEMKDRHIHAVTMDGDRIAVNLKDMSISINDASRPHPPEMLHDCQHMKSKYGSGEITVTTGAGSVTFDGSKTLWPMPDLPKGESRWGNPISRGLATTVAHTRALGGLSPDRKGMMLKSVSVFLPRNNSGHIRFAVYAGGTLKGGPHTGAPARLLFDFGKTIKKVTGWVTLEHPRGGVPLSAHTPIWIAWKGASGKLHIQYQEGSGSGGDFQTTRGRWESKAIASDENKAWPTTWPADDTGAFADYSYSCYLNLTFNNELTQ